MNLLITDHTSIEEIQEKFHKTFPFLRLQFFHHSHKAFQGSSKKELLSPNSKLKSIRHKNGDIDISEDMTVTELEQMFHEKFNLNVQVFRKSGRSWIETTITDNWTLKKQNDEGRELSELQLGDE